MRTLRNKRTKEQDKQDENVHYAYNYDKVNVTLIYTNALSTKVIQKQ